MIKMNDKIKWASTNFMYGCTIKISFNIIINDKEFGQF